MVFWPQQELNDDGGMSGGAFSGSAITVADDFGPTSDTQASVLKVFFTRHLASKTAPSQILEYQSSAYSVDGGLSFSDEQMVLWRESDDIGVDFRDPKVNWIADESTCDGLAGHWSMVVASNMPLSASDCGVLKRLATDIGGPASQPLEIANSFTPPPGRAAALLQYTSNDLYHWQWAGVLLQEPRGEAVRTYECPDFFELDGVWIAAASLMNYRDGHGRFQPVVWYAGEFDGKVLDAKYSGLCDFGGAYYASQSFVHDGRRIVIGWLCDFYGVRAQLRDQVNGVMSFPRELHWINGTLVQQPVAEVYQELLGQSVCEYEYGRHGDKSALEDGLDVEVPENAYYCACELLNDDDFTIQLASSRLMIDRTNSSCDRIDPSTLSLCRRSGHLSLKTQGAVMDSVDFQSPSTDIRYVEIFFDRQVAEVFVNHGDSVGSVIFPSDAGKGRIEFDKDCKAVMKTVSVRQLRSI